MMSRNRNAIHRLDPRIQQQRQAQDYGQTCDAKRQRNAQPADGVTLLAQATVRTAQQASSAAGSTRALPSSSLLTVGIMSYLALSAPGGALAAPLGGRRMLSNLSNSHTGLAPAAPPQLCDILYHHLGSTTQPATPSFVDCDLTVQPAIPTPQQAQARVNDSQPVYTYDNDPPTQLFGKRGPLMTDVMEGQIGQCVMSALQSAYAQARPELIESRIKQAWRHAIYNVTVTNPATRKDEPHYGNNAYPTLPSYALSYTNNYPGRIVTYGASNLVTWPMAMEKGVVQAAGTWHNRTPTYLDVVAGTTFSMAQLPVVMFNDSMTVTDVASYGSDNAALLQALTNASFAGVPTIVGSKNSGTTDGIVAEHAYTLLGTTSDGKILARNPWSTQNPASVLERLYMLNTTADGTVNVLDRGFMAITPETFRANYLQIYRGAPGKTPGPVPSLVDTNFTLVHKGDASSILSNPMDFDYGWMGNLQDGPPDRG